MTYKAQIKEAVDAVENLRGVICDSDGQGSTSGSEQDNEIITNSMMQLNELVNLATDYLEGHIAEVASEQKIKLIERTAQCIAHRACCGSEHNPAEGKLHGYCVVCGVPWPCEYVGKIGQREKGQVEK